jgi:predicted nucleotidyltransferase
MDLKPLLKDVYTNVKQIYGDDLVKLILYGSYARGDYNEDSDVDILALVKCDDKAVREYNNKLVRSLSELDEKYSALISVMTNTMDYFNYWKDDMPYFKNVIKDGIEINA